MERGILKVKYVCLELRTLSFCFDRHVNVIITLNLNYPFVLGPKHVQLAKNHKSKVNVIIRNTMIK